MKKLLILLVLAVLSAGAFASSGHGPKLDPVDVDLNDTASLQRGARNFANYCLGCHSAK